MDGLSIEKLECSTGSIVVQMASPSATFILESVVCGHHIYKLDVGYRRSSLVQPRTTLKSWDGPVRG